MTRKVRGSDVIICLRIDGNGGHPRLISFLKRTCSDIPTLNSRAKAIGRVTDALMGKGIAESDRVSYGMMFENAEEALGKRGDMVCRLRELGLGRLKSGRLADAIVTNASLLGVMPNRAHVDILFAMVDAAISANVPCRAVCEVIKNNLSNGVPVLFAKSCVEVAQAQGHPAEISETMLASRLSSAIGSLPSAE